MDGIQLIASMLSGGLAGGCISAISNHVFHWRALRTQFHPKLNNIFGEYAIRMENPEGRYRTGRVGCVPPPEDASFVNHRSDFIMSLPQFNELKEARELRRVLINNPNPNHAEKGTEINDGSQAGVSSHPPVLKYCAEEIETLDDPSGNETSAS
jgi:hypothetical protein